MTQTLEEKIAKGLKSDDPATQAYWRNRQRPAFTRKARYIQEQAADIYKIVSQPHTCLRNGKIFRSGGEGKASLVLRASAYV